MSLWNWMKIFFERIKDSSFDHIWKVLPRHLHIWALIKPWLMEHNRNWICFCFAYFIYHSLCFDWLTMNEKCLEFPAMTDSASAALAQKFQIIFVSEWKCCHFMANIKRLYPVTTYLWNFKNTFKCRWFVLWVCLCVQWTLSMQF